MWPKTICLFLIAVTLPFTAEAQRAAGQTLRELLDQFIHEAGTSQQSASAEQIARLIKTGQLDRAGQLLEGLPKSSAAALRLRDAVKTIKPDEAIAVMSRPTAEMETVPLGRLSDSELAVFKPLEKVGSRVLSISVVSTGVKQFVIDLASGADQSAVLLALAPPQYRDLIKRWKSVPPEKRIFLVGAGANSELIERYIAEQEREGFAVFFYQVCQTAAGALCAHEMVGAFLGDAGKVVVVDTAEAAASPFVFHEAAAAQRIRAGEALMIMVSPRDLLSAAKTIGSSAESVLKIQATQILMKTNNEMP